MPHAWFLVPCRYTSETETVRQQNHKPKINIWKTVEALELGSWLQHTAAAMESLLFASADFPLTLCPGTRNNISSILWTISSSAWSWKCPGWGLCKCAAWRVLHSWIQTAFAAATLNVAPCKKRSNFTSRPNKLKFCKGAFTVHTRSPLSYLLCKGFQIHSVWHCWWGAGY